METAPTADTVDVAVEELSDPELISRVRDGDVDAYGTLFARHVDAATRLARMLARPGDADDLVSDAFVKVLNVLLGGGGPDVAFRAYLLTAVRRLHVDRMRSTQRLQPVDDLTPYDPGVPFTDTAVTGFEGGAAAKAFASLPERWQMVLWHLEVENQKPADIAPLLGMSPNSVSALAYRAREGLRQAFLTMHAGDLVDESCRETNDLLGGYVRGALSKRDTGKVDDHLVHCRRCTAAYLELADVNSSLAAILGPALLGTAAAGYLASAAGGATAGSLGLLALLGRGRDFVAANTAATAAGATAVGVALATVVFVATNQGSPGPARAADRPARSAPSIQAPEAQTPAQTEEPVPEIPPRLLRQTVRAPAPVRVRARAGTSAAPTATPSGAPAAAAGADAPSRVPHEVQHPAVVPSAPPSAPPSAGPPASSAPPPAPTPDLRVTAGQTSSDGRVSVDVRVLGLPAGLRGTLVATADTGSFRQVAGPACGHVPHGFSCAVSGDSVLFRFENTTSSGPTMTFRVSGPSGYTDPEPGNNTTTVQVAQ